MGGAAKRGSPPSPSSTTLTPSRWKAFLLPTAAGNDGKPTGLPARLGTANKSFTVTDVSMTASHQSYPPSAMARAAAPSGGTLSGSKRKVMQVAR